MQEAIYFGMSAMLGMVAWFTIFGTFVWPRLKEMSKIKQLKFLTTFHFFRYFGMSFLIPGLVVSRLPSGFADPAAIGDMVALFLAYLSFIILQRSNTKNLYVVPVWALNIVGATDLLLAIVLGPTLIKNVGDFGVTYIIPTFYVPLLLVAHFYAFKVLAHRSEQPSPM